MNDVYKIFDDGFQKLTELDEIGFENCFRIAADLTKIAVYSNFKHGVLVAEVLEGVFGQVGPLFEMYDIPKDRKKVIKDKIIHEIYSLSSTYKNDNGAAVYESLAMYDLQRPVFNSSVIPVGNVFRSRHAYQQGALSNGSAV